MSGINERAELIETLRRLAGHKSCGFASQDAMTKAADLLESQAVAGEAAMYQVRLVDINSGIVSQDWRETSKQTFDAVRGQPHQGNQLRCEYRTLYTAPQSAPVDFVAASEACETAARTVIEAWLSTHAPGYPDYSMTPDGLDWAFWVADGDTTSYLHAGTGLVEWYGTGWPDYRQYDHDTGMWSEVDQHAVQQQETQG